MIYYDTDVDGHPYPLWFIVGGAIDWNQPTVFFPINQTFDQVDSIGLNDGALGCAVHAEELIINQNRAGQFGINLAALRTRIGAPADLKRIGRLIIRVADIEDVLSIRCIMRRFADMASFQKYKTKQGCKWLFKMYTTIDPQTGRKKQTTFRGYNTKRGAQRAALLVKDQLDKQIFGNDKITYGEVYKRWWDVHKRTLKPSTRDKTTDIFQSRILPYFKKIRVKEIDQDYCQSVIDQWRKDLSESTAKDYKGHASQVFKYAMSREWIFKNPMQFVVVAKTDENAFADEEEDEEENFWDSEQFQSFQKTASHDMDDQDYVLFLVLGSSGLRKGEMLNLKWSDVDFENKLIRIRRTLYFRNKTSISQTTKTMTSKRETPMTDNEIAVLKKWKTMQKARFLSLGIQQEQIQYVVCRDDLRPLRLAHPNDRLNKYLMKHPELPHITVHGFRHTFASNLYAAKIEPKTAQKFLGHKRLETTMNIYTHVAKRVQIESAEKYQIYMKNTKQK
ncbi:MAG: site-specific integrase [Sporolactobacillus sp.]|jgi:integrase|nr:site-specific integrase [Sporolactobacillus sp.]